MALEKLNLEQMRKTAEVSPNYKAMFKLYSERKRGRQDSTVSRSLRLLREGGLDVKREELTEFYRLMQQSGAGRWVAGRHGKEGRFVWNVNLVSVARAVLNPQATDKDVEPAAKVKVRLPRLVTADVTPSEPPKLRAVPNEDRKVMVRASGFEFEFPLEVLTNPAEAAEVSTFLKSLNKTG